MKAYIEQNRDRFLEELFTLLRIPSISAKPEHKQDMYLCAETLANLLLEAGADTIVLGCTHYPFLLPVMEKVAALTPGFMKGSGTVRFVDPAPAVARRLESVLREKGIDLSDPEPGVELLASGPDTTLRRLFGTII